MNIHELIRPCKRKWRDIRERRDFEYVRQGYNDLKLPHTEDNSSYCAEITKDLLALGFAADSKIVDAGCGAGTLCRQLRAGGFTDVTAFDISDENVEAARPFAVKSFRSSCENIADEDGRYDLVLSITVIEHVMDAPKALSEFHRILKPGGSLYLTTDNSWWHTLMSIKNVLTPPSRRERRFPQPIDGDFTTSEMGALLRQAGFIQKRLVGIGGIPCGNRLIEWIIGGRTTQHPFFMHFTTRMGFMVQKAQI